jgi:RHS repeat-associated protein
VNVINGAELMTETGSLRFVVGLNALAAGYDANGNMTLRLKDGARYFLAYDAESRLTSVSGTVSASFAYNGDGQRVTYTIGATITTYIGGYFEWQGGVGKSYYFAGAQRIAMRTGTDLKFLLGDHLGSTSVTALASGAFDTETRYYPWGGVRYSYGTTPTDYRFTGQQEIATIGLYFYNSRFYDTALGRFVSPDSIIPNPGDPVSFDRFAYVRNDPLKYVDPSGHNPKCGPDGVLCDNDESNDGDFWALYNPNEPIPEFPENIPDPEDRANPTPAYPDGFIVPTWQYYQEMVKWLWNHGYAWAVDGAGKINDVFLMALIIYGEFGALYDRAPNVYEAALGALSNQYISEYATSNIQCGGNCTLAEQIAWLSDMEAWYKGRIYSDVQSGKVDIERYYADALRVSAGITSDYWFWGDTDDPNKYPGAIYYYSLYGYPGKPYFVVYPP